MKTTHLLILLLSIFLISTSAFAQDDFYTEKQSEKTVSPANNSDTLGVSIFDEENYMSEEDYYETYYNDEYNGSEVYSFENERVIEEEQRKARNRRVAGEIVGEIIYNVVFSIAVILTW